MKQIQTRTGVRAVVPIPGSKSVGHRALIAASLGVGESRIRNFGACEDTLFTLEALRELGVSISARGEDLAVSGTGGRFPFSQGTKSLFLGNSGTSYRLLMATVSLARGDFMLRGSKRMEERPVGGLIGALVGLGVAASCPVRDGFPPVLIRAGGIQGGNVEVVGDLSSQYVSSILLAAPYAARTVELDVSEGLVSRPYVDLTIDVMAQFGVSVERKGYRYFKVPSGQTYKSRDFSIEGDVSSASYFWAAAAVTGGTVITENIHPYTTPQGDIEFLRILEQMGCRVEREPERVLVNGRLIRGIDVDMSSMPDMVPTLAVIACLAPGKTIIRHVQHLRHKESDRLRSVALELSKLNARVEELPDGLVIHGGGKLLGKNLEPYDDHRMAMSLAVIGLVIPGVTIAHESCVNKSFPRFWELWDRL